MVFIFFTHCATHKVRKSIFLLPISPVTGADVLAPVTGGIHPQAMPVELICASMADQSWNTTFYKVDSFLFSLLLPRMFSCQIESAVVKLNRLIPAQLLLLCAYWHRHDVTTLQGTESYILSQPGSVLTCSTSGHHFASGPDWRRRRSPH